MRPNPAMVERMQEHRKAGDTIYVFCNRPVDLLPGLEYWLGLVGGTYDAIYLPDREFPDLTTFKIALLTLLGIDRHYDDHWQMFNMPIVFPPVGVPASF
jgi:hypothetical protein